jgi:hypothetical protein
VLKPTRELVDDLNHRVALGHRKSAARAEVVLHVNHQQGAACGIFWKVVTHGPTPFGGIVFVALPQPLGSVLREELSAANHPIKELS